jgi:hypothetical protein
MNKKMMLLISSILLASPIAACPKKRALADYQQEDLTLNDGQKKRPLDDDYEQEDVTSSDDSVDALCESFKKVEVTTRRQEEDRRDEQYRNLIARRFALRDKEYLAGYVNTPELQAEKDALNQAFVLYEAKAKQLRDEVNPACDLSNKDWDQDQYWK